MRYIQAELRRPAVARDGGTAGGRAAEGERREAAGRAARRGRLTAVAGCLFCRVREARDDRSDLVLARRPHALLMLNRFPYNPAHLMVAVARHVPRFGDLDPGERTDLLDLIGLAEAALAAEYHPEGVNYGLNVGRVAGAGFPGHLHMHLVPRWNGDTNFMPIVGETKVLPESLQRTWSRLRRALKDSSVTPARPGAGRKSGTIAVPAARRGRTGKRAGSR
jgi:ATP adenylyltransferase